MGVLMKKRREHVQKTAKKCGISCVVADMIIRAYVEDLRDTLFEGCSVKIDSLVTIHVTPDGEGGYKTSSAVSKTLRSELHNAGKAVNMNAATEDDGLCDDV